MQGGLYCVFSKIFQYFATSTSQELGHNWLHRKWPANKSDCKLRSKIRRVVLLNAGDRLQWIRINTLLNEQPVLYCGVHLKVFSCGYHDISFHIQSSQSCIIFPVWWIDAHNLYLHNVTKIFWMHFLVFTRIFFLTWTIHIRRDHKEMESSVLQSSIQNKNFWYISYLWSSR